MSYNGILTNQLFVEGRFSVRHFTFIGVGAPTTDLIDGTLLIDRNRGFRYWSPTFCGICDDEKRDNDNEYVKATYFKSTKSAGSHNLAFGFDSFNDKRFANAHQSGSDYRILGTTSIIRSDVNCTTSPGCIFPQFLPGSTILQYNPIQRPQRGYQLPHDRVVRERSGALDVEPHLQPRAALGQEQRSRQCRHT